jgi:hypothetical protein
VGLLSKAPISEPPFTTADLEQLGLEGLDPDNLFATVLDEPNSALGIHLRIILQGIRSWKAGT